MEQKQETKYTATRTAAAPYLLFDEWALTCHRCLQQWITHKYPVTSTDCICPICKDKPLAR